MMIVGSRSRVFPSVQNSSRSDLLGLSKERELVDGVYVYVCVNERVCAVYICTALCVAIYLEGRCTLYVVEDDGSFSLFC
jgi:hypothetical protein